MLLVKTTRRRQQFAGVHQHRHERAQDHGQAIHLAKGHFPPVLLDREPHDKTAEEELLDQGHYQDQSEKTDG